MGAALVKRCFSGDSDASYERHALAKSRTSSSSSSNSNCSTSSHSRYSSRHHHHHHHSSSTSHDAAAAALLARRTLQLRQLELQMQQLTKHKASLSSSTPHELSAASRSSSSRRSARATLIAPATSVGTPLSMTSSYSTTMSESSFVDAQPQDDEILDMVMANAGLAFHPTQQWTRQPQSQPRHYHHHYPHAASSAPTPPARPAPLTRQRSTQSFRSLLPEAYVLQEVLGTGTTSTCYRCERRADGTAFACKVIDKRRLAVSTRQRHDIAFQLRREVDVLKRVDHPNIAKLEAAFENDAYLILLMELLDGGELFDAIVERGRFREREAIQVARAVLSAMQYMHRLGVVHRDLKPENMLLATAPLRRSNASTSASSCSDDSSDDDRDEVLTVKIIDFGFAKFLSGEHATTTSFLGTGGYLAPEILLHHPYSSAVDMWAFGVLLYLLLSGRLPFAASTHLRPNQKITSLYRLTFPSKYWGDVSPAARDLVERILVLNPRKRFTATDALQHEWLQ